MIVVNYKRSIIKLFFSNRYIACMLCCVASSIFGCRESSRIKQEPSIEATQQHILSTAKQTIAGNFSSQMELHFDSAALPTFLIKYPGFASYSTDLKRFYEKRKYAFAWYDSSGLIEQAGNLFNRSQHLNQEGLNLKLPYNDSFKALMEGTDSTLRIDPRNAEAELMLTAQYFSFARHAWQGMGEAESRRTDWFLSRKVLDLEMLIDSLLSSSKKAPGSREPVYRQYALLKDFLKKYRDI